MFTTNRLLEAAQGNDHKAVLDLLNGNNPNILKELGNPEVLQAAIDNHSSQTVSALLDKMEEVRNSSSPLQEVSLFSQSTPLHAQDKPSPAEISFAINTAVKNALLTQLKKSDLVDGDGSLALIAKIASNSALLSDKFKAAIQGTLGGKARDYGHSGTKTERAEAMLFTTTKTEPDSYNNQIEPLNNSKDNSDILQQII